MVNSLSKFDPIRNFGVFSGSAFNAAWRYSLWQTGLDQQAPVDEVALGRCNLGHVDKWRSQRRIDVMSMKPKKLFAVLSYRVATRRAFFGLLKQRSTKLRTL